MNNFPKQILFDYHSQMQYSEVIEMAIDEGLTLYGNNYCFELESAGISFGIEHNVNLAYFNIEYSKELDVRKLIYGK